MMLKRQEFLRCFESGKLHHSWLITGIRGVGKATLAWRIAKFILTQPLGKMEHQRHSEKYFTRKPRQDRRHR